MTKAASSWPSRRRSPPAWNWMPRWAIALTAQLAGVQHTPTGGRTPPEHLRRFISTKSGRKALYARLMVEALDLKDVPRPLDRVLAHV